MGWNNPAPSRYRFGATSTIRSPIRGGAGSQSSSCTKAGPRRCPGQRKESTPVAHIGNLRAAHTPRKNYLHSLRELQKTQVKGMTLSTTVFDCLLIFHSATV
jgi:hypothetical protein